MLRAAPLEHRMQNTWWGDDLDARRRRGEVDNDGNDLMTLAGRCAAQLQTLKAGGADHGFLGAPIKRNLLHLERDNYLLWFDGESGFEGGGADGGGAQDASGAVDFTGKHELPPDGNDVLWVRYVGRALGNPRPGMALHVAFGTVERIVKSDPAPLRFPIETQRRPAEINAGDRVDYDMFEASPSRAVPRGCFSLCFFRHFPLSSYVYFPAPLLVVFLSLLNRSSLAHTSSQEEERSSEDTSSEEALARAAHFRAVNVLLGDVAKWRGFEFIVERTDGGDPFEIPEGEDKDDLEYNLSLRVEFSGGMVKAARTRR
jgi:hypothetical protein